MVFLSKEQVLELFKNSFDIIEFNEVEKDGKTGLGKMKHWHIFNVIAKKLIKTNHAKVMYDTTNLEIREM